MITRKDTPHLISAASDRTSSISDVARAHLGTRDRRQEILGTLKTGIPGLEVDTADPEAFINQSSC